MEYAIETEKLTKIYRNSKVKAVDDQTMKVPSGEVFGFLGPNGAGKTTTIYMLLGILRPTSGEGRILGHPLGSNEAKERIGFLPESATMHLHHSGLSLLHYYGALLNMRREDLKTRARKVLELAGLSKAMDQNIATYSKGMLQRLGIAQALLNDPDLLILDEPTANLDPIGRKEVKDLLMHVKEHRKTIFISSHILSDIEQLCDRIAILKEGRLIRSGTIAELIGDSSSTLEDFFYRTVTGEPDAGS
ncbi:MAG: ABC transporter ATP-binding protein [Candidatus Eremiobacteraeota bacterium]|nr:ABC transporter ATP-binding protein [Candidatus Eremiobacteraeota bacterium]